jgi:hypothetical protein
VGIPEHAPGAPRKCWTRTRSHRVQVLGGFVVQYIIRVLRETNGLIARPPWAAVGRLGMKRTTPQSRILKMANLSRRVSKNNQMSGTAFSLVKPKRSVFRRVR